MSLAAEVNDYCGLTLPFNITAIKGEIVFVYFLFIALNDFSRCLKNLPSPAIIGDMA